MRKRILIVVLISVVVAGLLVTLHLVRGTREQEVYKIGAILPLTGQVSMAGQWMKNGIELAVAEINQKGGINGKRIRIIYGDSKNQGKEGIAIANKMLALDEVSAIIATMSGVAAPLVPLADKNKTVLLVTLVSLPRFTELSDWVFRYHISGQEEAETMAKFAYQKLQLKALGILYINDEFGVESGRIFRKNFKSLGGKILLFESYEKTGRDFRSVLQKVRGVSPPGLYILGYGQTLALVVKQAREVGIKSTILSMNALALPKYLEITGEAAEGAYCTVPTFTPTLQDEDVQEFVRLYKSKFHSSPNFVSVETFDMVKLLAEAIRNSAGKKENVRKELLKIKNFDCLMGKVTTLSDGEIIFPLTVKRVQNGAVVEP